MKLQHIAQQLPPGREADLAVAFEHFQQETGHSDIEQFVAYLREQGLISPETFCAIHAANEIEISLADEDQNGVPDLAGVASSHYRLLGRLGKGAMGEVHIAQDGALLRKVAYKRMLPKIAKQPRLLARFWNEVQVTSQLDHPNILPVYSLEVSAEGVAGYAMKLIQGRSLTAIIQEARKAHKAGRVEDEFDALSERLEYFLKVCDALAYAHAKRVLHRDLKPDNVMIGLFGEVYVVDWGICRVMGKRDLPNGEAGAEDDPSEHALPAALRTQAGAILGTPRYMSPEQAQGRHDELDGRSDLYALGLILFELTALRPATSGKTVEESLVNAYEATKEPLVHINPDVSIAPGLAAIIHKATARDPDDRYARVEDLADDIRNFLRDDEVRALPDTSFVRVQRFISKHRTGTIAALMVLLALGIAAGIAVFAYHRTGAAEHEARILAEEKQSAEREARVLAEEKKQREEEERLALMLHMARESLERDPGLSLSYLKELSEHPRFLAWDEARSIASDALSRGVPAFVSAPWLEKNAGHQSPVLALATTPDGNTLFSAGADGALWRWDLSCQRKSSPPAPCEAPREMSGHKGPVTSLRFSPLGDILASAGNDGTVRLWSAGGEARRTLRGHTGAASALSFSLDGLNLASASADGTVRLWDVSSGDELRAWSDFEGEVSQVAFSPDGESLAALDKASVWKWKTSAKKAKRLAGPKARPRALAFSPDGKTLAVGGEDNLVWLFRGEGKGASLTGHDWPVRALAFSPDGEQLASASEDRTVRLWTLSDCKKGDCSEILGEHLGSALGVSFSPDGAVLASTGRDQVVRLWDVVQQQPLRTLGGHQGLIRGTLFTKAGEVVTAGDDRTIRFWDTQHHQIRAQRAHEGFALSVDFGADGLFATGGQDGFVRLWSADGSPLASLRAKGTIWAVVFSPNGERLASAGEEGEILLWDTSAGALAALKSSVEEGEARDIKPALRLRGHVGDVHQVAFSPDGSRLYSVGKDLVVREWDLTTGVLRGSFSGHTKEVFGVAVSPDGKMLASTGHDGTIRLWGLPGGKALAVIPSPGEMHRDFSDLHFSPDGAWVAVSSYSSEVLLFQVEGFGKLRLAATLDRHRGEVEGLCFSPDGRQLASASWDGTARITSLDAATLSAKQEPASRALHSYGMDVDAVAFSRDGKRVAFVSEDGLVYVTDDDLPFGKEALPGFLRALSTTPRRGGAASR